MKESSSDQLQDQLLEVIAQHAGIVPVVVRQLVSSLEGSTALACVAGVLGWDAAQTLFDGLDASEWNRLRSLELQVGGNTEECFKQILEKFENVVPGYQQQVCEDPFLFLKAYSREELSQILKNVIPENIALLGYFWSSKDFYEGVIPCVDSPKAKRALLSLHRLKRLPLSVVFQAAQEFSSRLEAHTPPPFRHVRTEAQKISAAVVDLVQETLKQVQLEQKIQSELLKKWVNQSPRAAARAQDLLRTIGANSEPQAN